MSSSRVQQREEMGASRRRKEVDRDSRMVVVVVENDVEERR